MVQSALASLQTLSQALSGEDKRRVRAALEALFQG
jgi:hypothetical protein